MRVKGWEKFQHYKDRKPSWIKLYRDLLDDLEWHKLSGDDAKLLINLWILASEADGYLPDSDVLAFRLRADSTMLADSISRLNHWVIQDDSELLADGYQDASPEKEKSKSKSRVREEKEREEDEEGDFRFRGRIIKLSDSDYRTWESSYPSLDLNSELQALDDYYHTSDSENWFRRCSASLAKKHRENQAVKNRSTADEFI